MIHDVTTSICTHESVRATMVCQMLKRFRAQRSGMSAAVFNERTVAANDFLEVLVSGEDDQAFWPHSELWSAPASLFPDGTHLDWNSDYKRYYRSIRGAIIKLGELFLPLRFNVLVQLSIQSKITINRGIVMVLRLCILIPFLGQPAAPRGCPYKPVPSTCKKFRHMPYVTPVSTGEYLSWGFLAHHPKLSNPSVTSMLNPVLLLILIMLPSILSIMN